MTTFYTVVSWLVILGYWLLIAGVTLRILMKRRAVPSAMAWLLIIYILPLVGVRFRGANPYRELVEKQHGVERRGARVGAVHALHGEMACRP